jgi:hypothetical protein
MCMGLRIDEVGVLCAVALCQDKESDVRVHNKLPVLPVMYDHDAGDCENRRCLHVQALYGTMEAHLTILP